MWRRTFPSTPSTHILLSMVSFRCVKAGWQNHSQYVPAIQYLLWLGLQVFGGFTALEGLFQKCGTSLTAQRSCLWLGSVCICWCDHVSKVFLLPWVLACFSNSGLYFYEQLVATKHSPPSEVEVETAKCHQECTGKIQPTGCHSSKRLIGRCDGVREAQDDSDPPRKSRILTMIGNFYKNVPQTCY